MGFLLSPPFRLRQGHFLVALGEVSDQKRVQYRAQEFVVQSPEEREKKETKVRRARREPKDKRELRVERKASLKEKAARAVERDRGLEVSPKIQNWIWKKEGRMSLPGMTPRCFVRWTVRHFQGSAKETSCGRAEPERKRVGVRGRTE